MNFTVWATRKDGTRSIVSERVERAEAEDMRTLKRCLLMRSEEYDETTTMLQVSHLKQAQAVGIFL